VLGSLPVKDKNDSMNDIYIWIMGVLYK